jgi:HSP20 family protein
MTQLQAPSPSAAEHVDNSPTLAAAVDIFETKNDVWIVADLPGVEKKHLHIEAKDGEIALRGTAAVVPGEREGAVFARAFRLPPGVDVEGITAELKDGVVTLKLPKHSAMKPRVIGIS